MDKQVKYKSNKNNSLKAKTDHRTKKEVSITEWFYMTPENVSARMIADILKVNGFMEIELWEEMNILQLELPEQKTIDFEPVGYSFKDPSDAAFIKNRNIETIFAVTLEEETFEYFKPVLKIIFNEWSGFLCADSEDFKPIIDSIV